MADTNAAFQVRQIPLRELLPRCLTNGSGVAGAGDVIKACELLDSMYRGYPVDHVAVTRRRAGDGKDGFEVLCGTPMLCLLAQVMLGSVSARGGRVALAFRLENERFLAAGPEADADPGCIPDIAALYCLPSSRKSLADAFLARLGRAGPVDSGLAERLCLRLDRLVGLAGYPVTVFEFSPGLPPDYLERAVSRLDGNHTRLSAADMALAMTGNACPGLVEELYRFCRGCARQTSKDGAASFNHILHPAPRDLVAAALWRSGDGDAEPEERLCVVLRRAIDPVVWHGFLTAMAKAGFRQAALIGSKQAAYAAYGAYLWLVRHPVSAGLRDRLAGRIYLGLSLAKDALAAALARTAGSCPARRIEAALASALDAAFFEDRLPALMARPGTKTRAFLAYLAAQARLGAPVLFSGARVGDLLDYGARTGKKALERHHIHPRNHLLSAGVTGNSLIDRPGNLALVEWPDNLAIADRPPSRYVPSLASRFPNAALANMLRLNALWPGFEHDEFESFLARREALMARIVRRAYDSI